MRTIVATIIALASTGASTHAQTPEAWAHDLDVLARELPARHPNPFFRITSAQWDSAVGAVRARLPELDANAWAVEVQKLVARIGDAHTSVFPLTDPARTIRFYPVEYYHFDDGLFVRRTTPEHANIVGARVLRIGNVDIEAALAAAGEMVAHENEWWLRAWAPLYLTIAESVDGLGLVDDMERLPVVVDRDGERVTVHLSPMSPADRDGHNPLAAVDRSNWIDMRDAPREPRWTRNPELVYWHEYDVDTKTLYVSYRAVVSAPRGPSNSEFWDQVFDTADHNSVDRFIIDIRENSGGNGFLNRSLIKRILRRPALDRADVLYVIIGRKTFSAAQQLTNNLEWWTNATFVGEPTGQRPSQYGDHEQLVLPESHITVNISTVFHQAPNVFDDRTAIAPDIYTPLTSDDYRRGIDPAMTAAIAPHPSASILELITAATAEGDVARAERELRAAVADETNRYHRFEADINRLGYQLLNEHRMGQAIALFTLNAKVYPGSANVHDSLGEALAMAGRREEAIASYRKALDIDPAFGSAIDALRRLGARNVLNKTIHD